MSRDKEYTRSSIKARSSAGDCFAKNYIATFLVIGSKLKLCICIMHLFKCNFIIHNYPHANFHTIICENRIFFEKSNAFLLCIGEYLM